MSFQEHKIVYRQQFETANEDGVVQRAIMQACYRVVMVDHTTGERIATNKMGIVDILLDKYPQLKAKVEAFVPEFIAAFEKEYEEEQAKLNAASQPSSALKPTPTPPPTPSPTQKTSLGSIF